ncbi:RluA family pseudouridine synthase [Mesomycoplasma ovipneumoniae]|uniref:RluA family pseudouridine synthase n=1 Tax=Mesomycoplasma ovipneumoniae TaxID=29562 RepID=UPI00216361D9|nr:RluA family pseudouridine synthase [Mesomycoplasma ovipneumoniae]UVO15898.1 RluA family pseudouridine synthase [Mesomycoplasma ovipneumoniae]
MRKNQIINLIYDSEPIRIDVLVAKLTNSSRAIAQNLISNKKVLIDNIVTSKKNLVVKSGQTIMIINDYTSPQPSLKAAKIDFEIIFEDEDILLINKPKNLVVHPGVGNWDGTLVNGVINFLKNNLSDLDKVRPGIIHRLDKDTSGLILVAKNAKSHSYFADQLAKREIQRFYKAIVVGKIPHKFIKINLPIARDPKNPLKKTVSYFNSKQAITNVELIKHFVYKNQNFSLIKCQLETGRTHQIRLHLAHIGFPVYGDPIYGTKVDNLGQRLHAYKLIFRHIDGKELEFSADLPKEFMIAFNEKI